MSIQCTRLPHILVCAVAALLLPAAITCASETAPVAGPVAIRSFDAIDHLCRDERRRVQTTDAGEHWTAIAPALYDVHAPAVASVPTTVTVPADATDADFTVILSPVTTTTSVTMSATYGTTASAVLTVTPPPQSLTVCSAEPQTSRSEAVRAGLPRPT
jgi:hypothetical protein